MGSLWSLMVDDEAGVGIDGRLHILGRRLWSLANPHRPGIDVLAIALANKLARIAWNVLGSWSSLRG